MTHLNPCAAARVLGGEAHGQRILAPGPGHSARDRSLSILISWQAPEGFVVHSHAGDDAMACRDYVRNRLGLTRERDDIPAPRQHQRMREKITVIDRSRSARPLALWKEAGPIDGTPAQVYLASRGLKYDGDALRWHPDCPFGPRARVGGMLGLVRNIVTNEPQAVHRTAIDADGTKLSRLGANGRLALGPIAGGAIKLTEDEAVTLCLGLAEGIETALSMQLCPDFGRSPVWAAVHAGGIESFPVLSVIESLWLGVDHDPAGLRACHALAHRWHQAGREAFLIKPRDHGRDLNDLVQEARRHA
jgi:putative DNA primase/helicase